MSLEMKLGKGQKYTTQLVGQAGVWRIASKLAMLGHVPIFPGVDYGYDLMIENGLRLQVKTCRLKSSHPGYPSGAYAFDIRQYTWDSNNTRQRSTRNYKQDADFFVFWGVEDDRFWIIPTSHFRSGIWFSKALPLEGDRNYKKMRARQIAFEDRWDLLDVNEITSALVKSAEITVTA